MVRLCGRTLTVIWMSTLLEVWQRERKVAEKVGKRTLKHYYLLLKVNPSILYWPKRSYICFKSLTEIGHCYFTETRQRKFQGHIMSGKILELLWPQRRLRNIRFPVPFVLTEPVWPCCKQKALGELATTVPVPSWSSLTWRKLVLRALGHAGCEGSNVLVLWSLLGLCG